MCNLEYFSVYSGLFTCVIWGIYMCNLVGSGGGLKTRLSGLWLFFCSARLENITDGVILIPVL